MPIHRTSIESAVPTTTTNELSNGNVKAYYIMCYLLSSLVLENANVRYKFIY